MKTQSRLPISSITVGNREMHDYRSIVIDDRERTMVFQGTSRDRLGPIELNSTNFMLFKVSAFFPLYWTGLSDIIPSTRNL